MTTNSIPSSSMVEALNNGAAVFAEVHLQDGTHLDVEGDARIAWFGNEDLSPDGIPLLLIGVSAHHDLGNDAGYIAVPVAELSNVQARGTDVWALNYETSGATVHFSVEAHARGRATAIGSADGQATASAAVT